MQKRTTETYPRRFDIFIDGPNEQPDGEATKAAQGDRWVVCLPSGGFSTFGSSGKGLQSEIREWLGMVRTGRVTFGDVEIVKEEDE